MIKNIVFDLGKVLIDFRPENFLEKLKYSSKEVETLTKMIFYGEEWERYNFGDLSLDQVKDEVIKHYPNYVNDIKRIFEHMDYQYILFEMEDTAMYLKELKNEGYHIYILSDLSKDCYEYNKQFDFFQFIDGGVYSFEINSTKPNKKNYRALIDKFNLIPEETIFIDDRINNINAANELGITGILFTNLEEVKQKVDSYKK